MHYLVLAYDHDAPEVPAQRARLMGSHVARAAILKERGDLHVGGPILDERDQQIGSAQFVRFDTPDGLEGYIRDDPFMTGGVWDKVQVLKIDLRECTCVFKLRKALREGGEAAEGIAAALDVLQAPHERSD